MNQAKNRVLLVVDGSYQSLEVVNYVSEALPPTGTELVLLNIKSSVPETFWDLEKDPVWQQKVQTVKLWETQQENRICDFMDRALQILADAGFPRTAVKVDVRERQEGIARDIRAESNRGYDSVILGRRGLSTIQDLSLGGVAYKVVQKASNLAVWLIGGRPEPNKFLVGLDPSDGAMLAVDHLARMLKGTLKCIFLLNVVRKVAEINGLKGPEAEQFLKERTEKAEKEMQPVFEKALKKLQASGASTEILTKVITGVTSRAGTILDEARVGGYGTIVVGRRGLSTVEQFDMGRVSNKLMQIARDRALWVVG